MPSKPTICTTSQLIHPPVASRTKKDAAVVISLIYRLFWHTAAGNKEVSNEWLIPVAEQLR